MLRVTTALCGAALLLAGCQARAEVQSSASPAAIPEIISRCLDGREIAGQVATCTQAAAAKVGSGQLRALVRYSLALAEGEAAAPTEIPAPILRCLYSYDVEGRLKSCGLAIEARIGSAEMQALAHHARAIAHCRDGHPERSIADETTAIALVQIFPAAYGHRAECRRALGDLNGAYADQVEAIRLAPDVPGFYADAATLANLAGDHEAALTYLDEAIRRWPRFNTLLDLRAKTLFNLGRYNEAALAFVQTVKAFPGDERPVLWLHLARMHARQPDAQEFAANTARLSVTGWTKTIFDYYQGRAASAAVLQAGRLSDDPDAECATSLFVAEHLLAQNEPLAAAYFGGAVSTCDPQTSPSSLMAAWAELKKLSPDLKGKGWSSNGALPTS